ncbi:hypothetical protein IWX49DRAFT_315462 [Phyllosticta citricarpa]|uniref:Secreted protein n=2 Tax=Phyllosticta TaxID=121621 RepID=A0ABR1LE51_9PEZI
MVLGKQHVFMVFRWLQVLWEPVVGQEAQCALEMCSNTRRRRGQRPTEPNLNQNLNLHAFARRQPASLLSSQLHGTRTRTRTGTPPCFLQHAPGLRCAFGCTAFGARRLRDNLFPACSCNAAMPHASVLLCQPQRQFSSHMMLQFETFYLTSRVSFGSRPPKGLAKPGTSTHQPLLLRTWLLPFLSKNGWVPPSRRHGSSTWPHRFSLCLKIIHFLRINGQYL